MLLVLEDLHWADEASLRLLTFFRQEIAGAPVLAAASYRDVEVDDEHPLARHLSELSRDATFVSLDGLAAA
ncbi:MAG: hypothetical protein GY937_26290 [bacterium]|nr:hypothetical protein [bacterium]